LLREGAEEGYPQRSEHLPVAVMYEVRVAWPASEYDANDLQVPRLQRFEGQGGVVQGPERRPGDQHNCCRQE